MAVGLTTMIASSPLALLVPTKLIAPQPRPLWVSRERLITRLASIVRTPLTLVVAPAGFGKSTLVAQWLSSFSMLYSPPKVAWLTLDEHDQDGLRFLTYVVGAIARVCPHALTHTLPLLTAEEPPPLYHALHTLLVDLGALPGGLTLILDDYHTVGAEEVHQAVAYLLRHLPPGCQLVILSRIDPPLSLVRLRAEQRLTELRASDLRFTLDETAALLTNLLGYAPPALVSSFQQETEGWAIALQLAALAQQEAGARDHDAGVARRRVAEYLAEEVFDRQPEPIREALLALAVPERFCAGLYAALRGAPDDLASAEEQLGDLLRANLLLIPLDGEGGWYRFHYLFRDLLLRQLRLQMPPKVIATLELRAARWLEAEDLFEQAVRHYRAAGDEAAAAVVERLLPTLGRDQHALPPDAWLRLYPATLLAKPAQSAIAPQPDLLIRQARPAALPDLDKARPATLPDLDKARPATLPDLDKARPATLAHDLGKARQAPAPAALAPAPVLGPPELLTPREHEILGLLAERWSDKEIAAHLVIAPNTVRRHTTTIFGKLGVSNRREAVVVARALGLLPHAS